jgi:uncharacterized membrane protein
VKSYRHLLVLVLMLLPFAYAAYLFPSLPYRIPTHFNASGEVDAWGHKSTIFLLPSIMGGTSIFVYLILINSKKLDPKRYEKTDDGVLRNFAIYTVLFLTVLSMVILYAISHVDIKIDKLMLPLLGLAFGLFGVYMPRLKQNYFAGLRLPWTLDSERNWNATHAFAGKIWTVGGFLQFILGLILDGSTMFPIFISLVILMVLAPSIYSYLFFRKEKTAI